jgi:hypothetical protein
MKNFTSFLLLIFLVSCGKNASNGDNSTTQSLNPVTIQSKDLAGKEYIEPTHNGESILNFYETNGGSITLFLHPVDSYQPLEKFHPNSVKAVFVFREYKQIEDNIIELSKIEFTGSALVRDCSYCNNSENSRYRNNEIKKSYNDLLEGRETIRVRIIKDLKKNRFYMLNFGRSFF